jgi:hypothetical protein
MLPRFLASLVFCIQFSVFGRSPEQVAEWLEESSWSTDAQYNLGIAYMEGDGVPTNKPDVLFSISETPSSLHFITREGS